MALKTEAVATEERKTDHSKIYMSLVYVA